jgi:hypothetical protein
MRIKPLALIWGASGIIEMACAVGVSAIVAVNKALLNKVTSLLAEYLPKSGVVLVIV